MAFGSPNSEISVVGDRFELCRPRSTDFAAAGLHSSSVEESGRPDSRISHTDDFDQFPEAVEVVRVSRIER